MVLPARGARGSQESRGLHVIDASGALAHGLKEAKDILDIEVADCATVPCHAATHHHPAERMGGLVVDGRPADPGHRREICLVVLRFGAAQKGIGARRPRVLKLQAAIADVDIGWDD